MHLTQFSDFSLRVLLFLAREDKELATIDAIAERFDIPRNHLVKVVNRLAQEKLIETFRGRNGGFRLARKPGTYRIGEIVRVTEPHCNLVECFDRDENACPISGNCGLASVLFKARSAFFDALNQYTLADLLRQDVSARALFRNPRGSSAIKKI